MADLAPALDPHSSHGSAVRLLDRIGAHEGVVLDLLCGHGPAAEAVRDLGLHYVGLDVDRASLADLERRGFETAWVDLEEPTAELRASLAGQLRDRTLAAVLAIDALERLRDPAACVAAVTGLCRDHPDARFVVSLPNVTHVDLAAKLLLGRWEVRSTGLIEQTHVQFFDERRAVELITAGGWVARDEDDVRLEVTEQCDPPDAPELRPGSPLNDLLRSIRARADGHGTTYQFVRSYSLGSGAPLGASAPSRRATTGPDAFATVALLVPVSELPAVTADLAAQTERDFRVLVVGAVGAPTTAEVAASCGLAADRVEEVASVASLDAALVRSAGRYVCAIGPGEGVRPTWLRSFSDAVDDAPGRVLVAGCVDARNRAHEVARFDLVGAGLTGVVPGVAYAVPRSALAAGVIGYGGQLAHTVAGLVRASMWCGRYDLDEVTCSSDAPEDLAHLDLAVAALLDEEPLVLAEGSASPLIAMQRERIAARRDAADAIHEVKALKEHHDAYALASDVERTELHRKVAATATPAGVARITLRRAASIVRRRVLGNRF